MSTIRFSTEIIKSGSRVYIQLPESATKMLPPETMIEGVINFFPFRVELKNGQFEVNKTLEKAAKLNAGEAVPVEITRVGDEPEVRVPADLSEALKTSKVASDQWNKITPMARRDWVLSICTVKKQETRIGRIEKTIDMLEHGKGRVCCFPGIGWIMKGNEEAGIWLKLKSR